MQHHWLLTELYKHDSSYKRHFTVTRSGARLVRQQNVYELLHTLQFTSIGILFEVYHMHCK